MIFFWIDEISPNIKTLGKQLQLTHHQKLPKFPPVAAHFCWSFLAPFNIYAVEGN